MLMDATQAIHHARSHSRYLARVLDARPELVEALTASLDAHLSAALLEEWLEQTPFDPSDDATLKSALRRLRSRTMAHLIVRDLAGAADLDEVTEGMTLLAELTVRVAAEQAHTALVARFGEPRGESEGGPGAVQPFICIGMGKLGGRELNVSSDVDFIFVYPESGETDGETPTGPGKRIDNFDFFSRLGRKVIELLADLTADGFVFRVDMRLRPNGDSGPLVCSFDMLENYFFTQGREWERYAWIKARALTGNRHDELEALRKPFVFRKYLDFGAINAMRDLHAQIRREVARRDMADNVKLGPGGIREIEFIAQVFQLIRGRPRKRPADPSDAEGARQAGDARRAERRDGEGAACGLRIPASAGTPAAVRGRRADAQAAGQRGRPGADRKQHGHGRLCLAAGRTRRASRPCRQPLRRGLRRAGNRHHDAARAVARVGTDR
jgi:glutamate-ammonia-ligase adenylyltransferase